MTIYLSDQGNYRNAGLVTEYLNEYLNDSWKVVSMTPIGAAGVGSDVAGWLAVLLEKK